MNKKYITISIIIIATAWLLFFYFTNNQDEVVVKEEPVFSSETKFSRISFFNSKNIKASLEIPENWEGSYRLKESGEEVIFLSIVNPETPQELFRIKKFAMDKWQVENNGWQFLLEKNKNIFAYKLSTAITGKNENNKKYNEMLNQSSEILKRFKVN